MFSRNRSNLNRKSGRLGRDSNEEVKEENAAIDIEGAGTDPSQTGRVREKKGNVRSATPARRFGSHSAKKKVLELLSKAAWRKKRQTRRRIDMSLGIRGRFHELLKKRKKRKGMKEGRERNRAGERFITTRNSLGNWRGVFWAAHDLGADMEEEREARVLASEVNMGCERLVGRHRKKGVLVRFGLEREKPLDGVWGERSRIKGRHWKPEALASRGKKL